MEIFKKLLWVKEMTTQLAGCLLVHPYFKENYRLIATDLRKQQTLHGNEPKEGIKCDCLSPYFIFK